MVLAHTALAALLFYITRIIKGKIDKFGASCQLPNYLFVLLQNVVFINRPRCNECSARSATFWKFRKEHFAGVTVFLVRNRQFHWWKGRQWQTLIGSHRMKHGQILQKISEALPLIKIYRMTPLSARSFSMDSSFNSSKNIYNYCT